MSRQNMALATSKIDQYCVVHRFLEAEATKAAAAEPEPYKLPPFDKSNHFSLLSFMHSQVWTRQDIEREQTLAYLNVMLRVARRLLGSVGASP